MATFKKYLPALITLLAALVGLVTYLASTNGQKPDYTVLATQVEVLASASDQAAETSISEKDYTVCVATKSASGMIRASAQSLRAAATGTCHLPDVEVDISACVALKPVPTPTPAEGEPAPEALPLDQSETTAAAAPLPAVEPAPQSDPKAAVSVALDPLLALVTSFSATIQDPVVKAWALGVTAWIDSGKASILALIADPSSGKLSLKGVDIAGCTVSAK